jgi:drug/metabolite transporter (DMT)-like permease
MFGKFTRNKELQGIAIMILTCFCFACVNVSIRPLAKIFDPMFLVSLRSLFCIMLVLPLVVFIAKKQPLPKFSSTNYLKGFIDFISIPAWTLAIHNMKIGETVALSFITPLLSAILAIIFLKDKLSPKKWIAMLIGFTGAYIVLNPNSEEYNIYALFALFSCFCWAAANVMAKKLTNDSQHPAVIVLYGNIIIFILSLPFLINNGRMINYEEFTLLLTMSIFACSGHFCLVWAYTKTKMSNLIPFDYTRLVFSVILGYTLFGEVVGINTMIGTAIILLSSIYLATRKSDISKTASAT